MTKLNIAAVILLSACAAQVFAQSGGEATYKAKCLACHGAAGVPNPGIAKAMGVKAFTDADVKKMTEAEMVKATEEGKGKMPAFKGKLSDGDIKDVVAYLRTFK